MKMPWAVSVVRVVTVILGLALSAMIISTPPLARADDGQFLSTVAALGINADPAALITTAHATCDNLPFVNNFAAWGNQGHRRGRPNVASAADGRSSRSSVLPRQVTRYRPVIGTSRYGSIASFSDRVQSEAQGKNEAIEFMLSDNAPEGFNRGDAIAMIWAAEDAYCPEMPR